MSFGITSPKALEISLINSGTDFFAPGTSYLLAKNYSNWASNSSLPLNLLRYKTFYKLANLDYCMIPL